MGFCSGYSWERLFRDHLYSTELLILMVRPLSRSHTRCCSVSPCLHSSPFLEMHLNAKSCLYIHTHILYSSASEQLLQVDVQQGLPPVTEGAVLRQDKGLVLLFAQQREHVLHQLTESAVTVTSQGQRIHSEVCMKKGHKGWQKCPISYPTI